jgi:N-acetylneuraminic acid mutarotase
MGKSFAFLIVLVFLTASSIVAINSVLATTIDEDSWTTKTAMPTARSGLGVAVVNGKIYAIGGYNGSYLGTNEEYDPATDTWTTKAPMPTPRSSFAIAVVQNKIYVIGGKEGPSTADTSVANEVYDPATDTWETKSHAPVGYRLGFSAEVVSGKIYIIGGCISPFRPWPNTDANDVYDPTTDSWASGAPIPTPVFDSASAVLDNKIYIMGGRSIPENVTYDLTQIYDPATDAWSYGASVPTALSGGVAEATTGVMAPKRIYVLNGYMCEGGGGMYYSETVYLTQVYDPEKDAWSSNAQKLTRRGFGLAVTEDLFYAIGGYDGENYLQVNEQYTPIGYGTVSVDNNQPEPFSIRLVAAVAIVVAAVVLVAAVGVGLSAYLNKRK